jgi:acetyltransferase
MTTNPRSENLKRLFNPASIAVVGASTDPGKAGYQAVNSLRGFPGTLYPINPKSAEVLGFKAYPTLAAIGSPVDLVILAIPAAACVAAAREAAAARCGGIFIISGGFGESGAAGLKLQEELGAICRDTGLRMLGPNTSGFMNPPAQTFASFAPGVESLQPGRVAVVAQSGGVNLTLAFMLHAAGHGVTLSAGLGNAVDVDAADVLDQLAQDPGTRAIALHLEGVRDGRKLYEAIRRITAHTAVVALPAGRADVGAFAQSHTGNLIGSHARKVAALAQAGAIVVDSTDDLVDAAIALAAGRIAPKANPGIGLITGQAGPGLLIVDDLKFHRVNVPELGAAAVAKIEGLLPPLTFMKNPVDTGRPSPAFPQVLQALADDPAIDALLMFAIHEPAAVDPVAALAGASTAKPRVFGTMGLIGSIAPTLAALRAAGIAGFTSPERLALAGRVLAQDAAAQARLRGEVVAPAPASPAAPLSSGPNEFEAKALLNSYGIATPVGRACASHAQALDAFAALPKPVAAKILSLEIAHKTEAGGVLLNLKTGDELRAALARLDAIPLTGARAYLVESMAAPGVELIVGAVRDASFGPCVMLGLGGTAAEALKDTAVRLAPLVRADAQEMIGALRGKALLEGWRGAPACDQGAVERLLVSVSRLMHEHPEIAELDINPVRAYADGVLALDALVVLA